MPCSLLSRPPAAADRKGAAERPAEGMRPGTDSMAVLPLCVYREPALVAAAKMVWFDAIPKPFICRIIISGFMQRAYFPGG